MCAARPVLDLLDRFQPQDEAEAADVARTRELAGDTADPWARVNPLHLTSSALIVHPATGRVLLRWHQRQQAWLPVGGHGDPGESEPLDIAPREAPGESAANDPGPGPAPAAARSRPTSTPTSGSCWPPATRTRPARRRRATRCAGCRWPRRPS